MLNNTMKLRVNGFQWPPSRDQIKTLTVYPAIIVGYFLLIFLMIRDREMLAIFAAINSFLSVLLIFAWVTVEYIDPEMKPGKVGIPVICFAPPEKSARFCGVCRKTVAGLDHHCTWLNTCIGRRNYFSFISLVFIGATQSILQTVVGVFALSVWILDETQSARVQNLFDGKLWGFYTAVSLYSTISGFLAFGLLTLAGFHTYLMLYMGMGTYDWLLYRRGSTYEASFFDEGKDPELSRDERKKQREREEWQRVISNSRRKKNSIVEIREGIMESHKTHPHNINCDDPLDWPMGSHSGSGVEGNDITVGIKKPTTRYIITNKRKSSTDIESGMIYEDSTDDIPSPVIRLLLERNSCSIHHGINSEVNSSASYKSSDPMAISVLNSHSNHGPTDEEYHQIQVNNVPNTNTNIESRKDIISCPQGNEIIVSNCNENDENDDNKYCDKIDSYNNSCGNIELYQSAHRGI